MHDDHVKGVRLQTMTVWLLATWFFLKGMAALLLPEQLSALRGVAVDTTIPKEKRLWLMGIQQLQGMHSILMAALHVAVVGHGAKEHPRLHSVNHMTAVRSLLLVDTIWLSIACNCMWVFIVPDMKDLGWYSGYMLAESFVLAALSIPAFLMSRGEIALSFGPIRFRHNVVRIRWVPEFAPRNYGILFWEFFAAIGALALLFFPRDVLHLSAGDFLDGDLEATGAVLLQLTGLSMVSECLSLIAISGSGIAGLNYVSVRILWVWGFGMTTFFCLARQVNLFSDLPTEPMLFLAFVHLVGSIVARLSMPEFGAVAKVQGS
eukprot:TRINITY_DN12245_c0_g1_i1.p1 TRINITY_DN12245_c0_g1~~TRINITY_DN12245_c0_g1_i1.p1  ORF type:complete len:360 (+),score=48.43 TRINITY_DN12245_c0_g1_i1:126-1082(+)